MRTAAAELEVALTALVGLVSLAATAATLLATASPAAAAGPVELEGGSYDVIVHCEGEADTDQASDVLTFDRSVSGGCGTATQDSEFFDGPGGVTYSGTASVSGSDFRLNSSDLRRQFTVTEPVPWSATGSLSGALAPGEDGPNSAGAGVVLTGPDGFEQSFGAVDNETESISASGTLQPGEYELQIRAGSLGFSGNGSGSWQLELELGDGGGADSDGDGLRDSWEEDGVDVDDDGTPDLDLPSMGADPQHKDVFVEVDHMPGHRIDNAEIGRVVQAFADAPVGNPDGQSGIALHVDNGPASVMNPRTGATWGSFSDQEEVPHQNVLGTEFGDDDYDWSAFESLRQTRFAAARRPAFHYAIAAHSGPDNDFSGIAQGVPSADFLVFTHETCEPVEPDVAVECTPDPDFLAATFMHELGHTLGLGHGGTDGVNRKPNYLSVMNYNFGYGLRRFTGVGTQTQFELDYSRFSFPLDERSLDEQTGLGIASGPVTAYETLYRCPTNGAFRAIPVADTPVDWSCSGTIATNLLSRDITGEGDRTNLPGAIDWDRLVFDGGAIGGLAETPAPDTTPIDEPTPAELIAAQDALESGPVDDSGLPIEPGQGSGTPPEPAGDSPPPRDPAPPAAVPALTVTFSEDRAEARKGKRVRLTYVASAAADVELEISKGRKTVATVEDEAEEGENEIVWNGKVKATGKRRPAAPGTYDAVLTARSGDGRRASDTTKLKIKGGGK